MVRQWTPPPSFEPVTRVARDERMFVSGWMIRKTTAASWLVGKQPNWFTTSKAARLTNTGFPFLPHAVRER